MVSVGSILDKQWWDRTDCWTDSCFH